MNEFLTPSPAMVDLLRRSGSLNYEVARAAQADLARALTLPLQQGVLKGDIVTDIYEARKFNAGEAVEYPLDFLAPGTEKDFVAYTIPGVGRIPERHVEGDFVMVSTYEVGASIDWALKYSRDARWDVVKRAMEVLEASFVRKMNVDGWRVLLAAGVGRNMVVYDSAATAGLFTKRLVALMKTVMRRSAGGNTGTPSRGKLTRLYVSPEAMEDIRSWDLGQVDDITRREIFVNDEQGLMRIFGVELRELDELGATDDLEGQEFQNYFTHRLGGTFPGSKVELVVGLDASKDDSFVMPVKSEVEIFEDPTFHRQRRAGLYGFGEHGFACLDSRRVLLGAL